MAVQVQILESDSSHKKVRLLMTQQPKCMVIPTQKENGLIQIANRSILLRPDKTFTYGAWPQKSVSINVSRKLNILLVNKELRKNGHYYSMNGYANHEYPYEGKKYVLMTEKGIWLEVAPIMWVYDSKKHQAYTKDFIFENVPDFLKKYGWQMMQSNQFERAKKTTNIQKTLREATAEAIRSIRLLRDIEVQTQNASSLGHEMYELCKVSMKQVKSRKGV